ncbi:hypothetical protein GCM10007094_37330 [Pseudovibrio japonicus]|uniref:DUF4345 domain-containing protein n=1 Tax=Pseudovibrio japonicus TaxID=366534 RepID=A0ABQ3EKK8_9HYPH|nr:DUF4345 family protein [Pseudovibrio japonicus]GHB44532.1 hypothetical protein GCM10007094_37330 [Pseudovibrio japonicus]
MELAYQIMVGAPTLMLLGLGTVSMFAPSRMTKNFAVEPIGVAGLSTIRSVMGGLFLASVALLITGYVTAQPQAYVAVAILLGVVALGRVVSLLADGFVREVIPPLIVELVLIAALLGAFFRPF